MEKDTFIFRKSWRDVLVGHPAEVRLEVYDALIVYATSGTLIELKPLAQMAFSFIKNDIDINNAKYQEVLSKKRAAGKKGGLSKNKQNQAKQAYAKNAKQIKQNEDDNDNDILLNENINITPISPLGDSDTDEYSFDKFWDLYDKKVGDKAKIKKKWDKLSKKDKALVMEYIPKYISAQPNKQYRKNPETFINNSAWNDEIIKESAIPTNKFYNTEQVYTNTID